MFKVPQHSCSLPAGATWPLPFNSACRPVFWCPWRALHRDWGLGMAYENARGDPWCGRQVCLQSPFSSPRRHLLTIKLRLGPKRWPTQPRIHNDNNTLPTRPCTPAWMHLTAGVRLVRLKPHWRTVAEREPMWGQKTQHRVQTPSARAMPWQTTPRWLIDPTQGRTASVRFNTTIDAATVDVVMPLSFTMLIQEPCIYIYNILESTYSETVFWRCFLFSGTGTGFPGSWCHWFAVITQLILSYNCLFGLYYNMGRL